MTPPPSIPDHELLRLIGRGSYGEVWLARNVMGAWRAVKIVYRATFESERPYLREFSGIQRYEPLSRSNEGLVAILHVGRSDPAGCFYYVMELADPVPLSPPPPSAAFAEAGTVDPETYAARTLRSDLRRLGRLTCDECVALGLTLTRGLAQLHRHGLVHRDVKPSNIVFVNGVAKLADLGLVGGVGEARSFVGTEGFIPPEGPGAPSADLYALGKVLYEVSTGLDRQMFPELPEDWLKGGAPAGIMELHEVVLNACEGDPARRYADAAAMQADLALIQSGRSVRRVRQLERRLGVLRRWALAGGLVALAAVAGVSAVGYRARVQRENFERSERLRVRAETAELASRERLFAAQLARAAAERQTGRAGSRAVALEQIRAAAAIHPASVDLRSEAIAALALPDVHVLRRIPQRGMGLATLAADGSRGRYLRLEADGAVVLRRLADDGELARCEVPATEVDWLWGFSGDGRWAGGRDREGHALVWDTSTGRLVLRRIFPDCTQGYEFVNGADQLAVAYQDGRLALVTLPGGMVAQQFTLGTERPGFAISPDARHVAVLAGPDVRVFDLANGVLERTCRSTGDPGWAVVWQPDSRGFTVCGASFTSTVWTLDPSEETPVALRGHTAEVNAAAYSPAGDWLATASWDGTTRFWDPKSGRQLLRSADSGQGYEWSTQGQLTFLADDSAVQRSLVVAEVAVSEVFRRLSEPLPAHDLAAGKGPWVVGTMADGRVFAAPTHLGVRLWNAATGAEIGLLPFDHGQSLSLATAPDAMVLTGRGRLERWPYDWNRASGELRFHRPKAPELETGAFVASTAAGGRRLYATLGAEIHAWENGRHWTLGDQPGWWPKPMASPDGRWLVVNTVFTASLWLRDGRTGEVKRELADSDNSIAEFSPDSRWIAISGAHGLRVEEAATGVVRWRLARSSLASGPVRFSPDGRLVADRFAASSIGLVDAVTGELLARLEPPEPEPISEFTFSPDGAQLAVACPTHVVQCWDLRALRRELAALGLDWALPAYAPPDPDAARPVRVSVVAD